MPYPELARQVSTRRKQGDVAGALELARNAADEQRALPEVRLAIAWCFYDRDIKPCTDTDIRVTDEMIAAAQESLGKIHTWCNSDRVSQYSPFPTALLAMAKIYRDHDRIDEMRQVLDVDEALAFSDLKTSTYPSHLERWISLVLDANKRTMEAETPGVERMEPVGRLLSKLETLHRRAQLSNEKPTIIVDDKQRKIPSPRQRFCLQYTSYLQRTDQKELLVMTCRKILASNTFDGDGNLKWIVHRLVLGLIETDLEKALVEVDSFIAMEYRPYSVLLRAEILQRLGRREEALKDVAHSLQIIGERDLPYITKNLAMLAELTEDQQVRAAHVQMMRAIRAQEGHRPLSALEEQASQLGLSPEPIAPNTDELRAMWAAINPNPNRPVIARQPRQRRQTHQATHTRNASHRVDRGDISRYDTAIDRFGEIVLAPVSSVNREAKIRPVVVLGTQGDQVLIAPLMTGKPDDPRAFPLATWEEAGLKNPTVFVPTLHSIQRTSLLRRIGQVGPTDRDKIRNALA